MERDSSKTHGARQFQRRRRKQKDPQSAWVLAGHRVGYGRMRDYVRAPRPRQTAEPVVRLRTPAGLPRQVTLATLTSPQCAVGGDGP